MIDTLSGGVSEADVPNNFYDLDCSFFLEGFTPFFFASSSLHLEMTLSRTGVTEGPVRRL